MASKVVSLITLMVTVAAEVRHPPYHHGSSTYGVDEGDYTVQDDYSVIRSDGSFSIVDSLDKYNAGIERQSLPFIYDSPSHTEGERSSWNYFIPLINSGNLIPTTYPEPVKVLPLSAPWTHDVPHVYSTSASPTATANQQLPFGYVAPVAKISVPPGYKIH